MKKIFTLCVALSFAVMSAKSQTNQYGIYVDKTTALGSFYGVTDLGNDEYGPGVKTPDDGVVVEYTNGSATKYVLDLKKQFGSQFNINNEFNYGALIGDAYKMTGPTGESYSSNWSPIDAGVLVCTGFKNMYDNTDPAYISSDDDSSSRWPEKDEAGANIDYKKLNLYELQPDYWTGMTITVPEGKALNVDKITCALAAGNNMYWSIDIFDSNNNLVYDSKVAQIKNGNSTTESKQVYHVGYSADITSTEVIEPLAGENYIKGILMSSTTWQNVPCGEETCLPITKEKIARWTEAGFYDSTEGAGPASKFQPIPAGLQLKGKNTVRIYFCCKNSRLLGIDYLNIFGTLGDASGISNITVDSSENAPAYNLAGQAVSASYKGVVIKGGKKFRQN